MIEPHAPIPPMRPTQVAVYSLGAMGANVVTNLASAAFPLLLAAYALPTWLVMLLAQERSLVGAVMQPLVGVASDRFPASGLYSSPPGTLDPRGRAA